jgi:PAS domain S-box-containing protein
MIDCDRLRVEEVRPDAGRVGRLGRAVQAVAIRDDTLGVTDRAHLDPQALRQVVSTLLSEHPDAPVAAIDGAGNFVRMPASVPLMGRPVIGAYSAFDLVTGTDRAAVLEAWQRARAKGVARAVVHLADGADREGILHIVDARKLYGVYLGLLLAPATARSEPDRPPQPAFRPRFSVVRRDELGFVIAIDESTTAMLGWSLKDLIGQRALDYIHPEDNERALTSWMEMLAVPGSSRRWRGRHIRRDGSWLWLEMTNHNRLEGVDRGYVRSEMVDISGEMAMAGALRNQEQLLHRLAETVPVGVLQFDHDGRVTYANDRLYQIVGGGPCLRVDEQLSAVLPADVQEVADAIADVLGEGSDRDIDARLESEPGTPPRRCTINLRALTDGEGLVTGAIATIATIADGPGGDRRRSSRDGAADDYLNRSLLFRDGPSPASL